MRNLPTVLLGAVCVSLVLLACSDKPAADEPTQARTGQPTETAAQPTAEPTAAASGDTIRALDFPRELVGGTRLGADDAPVRLTMFEDFQCPFCLRFTAQDEPVIIEEYVLGGKVQLEFRHFPVLRGESITAAIAAHCAAEQDRFWEYHRELFAIQADAGQDTDEQLNVGRFEPAALVGVAEDVGLDPAAFEACVTSPDSAATVQADEAAAREAGLTGTPNFLVTIGGQTAPLPPTGRDPGGPAEWRTLLDALLEVAAATPTP